MPYVKVFKKLPILIDGSPILCSFSLLKTSHNLAGKGFDELWQLEGAMKRSPHWGANFPIAGSVSLGKDSFSSRGGARTRASQKSRLAITNGPLNSDDDSGGSIPPLESVSDSSEDRGGFEGEESYDSDDDYDHDEDGDSVHESVYDTEEEEELRDMLREAMNAALSNSDSLDPAKKVAEDTLAEERTDNPFLKLLGSLKGIRNVSVVDWYRPHLP